jgi:hypothetical protein
MWRGWMVPGHGWDRVEIPTGPEANYKGNVLLYVQYNDWYRYVSYVAAEKIHQ